MADTLPSPPSSRPSTPESEPEQKKNTKPPSQRLDELLEQYLEFLDQYTTLREELSRSFSSGFFSLAQAQRTSTLGAGRRYGQDCYDQRMKAQRSVKATDDVNRKRRNLGYKVVKRTPPSRIGEDETSSAENDGPDPDSDGKSKHSPENASRAQTEDTKDVSEREEKSSKECRKQDPATRDPITWFGLLAPPALRQCQSQFAQAVESQTPKLLTVKARLKGLEDEIWSVREELGILHEYDGHEIAVDAEEAETRPLEKVQEKQPIGAQTGKTPRRALPSRPAHSKSTLLKLGE